MAIDSCQTLGTDFPEQVYNITRKKDKCRALVSLRRSIRNKYGINTDEIRIDPVFIPY